MGCDREPGVSLTQIGQGEAWGLAQVGDVGWDLEQRTGDMSIWVTGSKDRLALLARGLADLQIAGEDVLPEDMPGFQSFPIRQPDTNGL